MQQLKFASLQSDIAKQLIPEEMLISSNAETVIFFDRQKIYTHSGAILRIMGNLPFPFTMLLVFMVIPTFLRDMVYNFIAKKRYRWFGKRETCRLPDAATKGRILG
jgi:predicted DCC family thiol-disulfide oxidoreductase YuxK